MKILVANPYLKGRQFNVQSGEYPRHHLWGADDLAQAGYSVVYVEGYSNPKLDRLSQKMGFRFGDLAFERQTLKQAKEADIVYAPAGNYFRLPLRRSQGRLKAKIATWRYSPPPKPQFSRLRNLAAARRIEAAWDGVAGLTSRTEAYYRQNYTRTHAEYIPWTVDENLFQPSPTPGTYGFACGRTCRDHQVIAEAAKLTGQSLVVLAPREAAEFYKSPPSNLKVLWGPNSANDDKGVPYSELVRLLQGASFSIIALRPAFTTAGYTNLIESIRMGLPIVMTRAVDLDIDVEREEIGYGFSEGNAAELADAIDRIAANHAELRPRTLAYFQNHLTEAIFGKRMVDFIERTVGSRNG